MKGGDLDHVNAQLCGERLDVDLVAALLQQVAHVEAHDDGRAALEDLGGKVEVALEVGHVNEVDDRLGIAIDKVVTRDDLLGAVGGQRVDAREVGEYDLLVLCPGSLLLFHRDAGPVAHVAVGARERVEQRGLAAVRVTR